jgi:hypothetical protein
MIIYNYGYYIWVEFSHLHVDANEKFLIQPSVRGPQPKVVLST